MIALVLGGAHTVWCDVEALAELAGIETVEHEHGKPCRKHGRTAHRIPGEWSGPVIAANDIGVHWPRRLDHLVSLHQEKIQRWRRDRKRAGYNTDFLVWLTENKKLSDRVLPFRHKGSSGMFAPRVAFELNCRGSVLCGIPLDPIAHFRESAEHKETHGWPHANGYLEVWQDCEDELKSWGVRSMSGRTRELLGAPTLEWLEGRE